MSSCNSTPPNPVYPITYGVNKPRFIRPLVRIGAMTEDMPAGYTIDPCLLPKTTLILDECAQVLTVNDASVSYAGMFPCLKLPQGSGIPTNPPAQGYYPFYVDTATEKSYVYADSISKWIPLN